MEEIGRAGAEAKQLVSNMGTVTEVRGWDVLVVLIQVGLVLSMLALLQHDQPVPKNYMRSHANNACSITCQGLEQPQPPTHLHCIPVVLETAAQAHRGEEPPAARHGSCRRIR